jgi:valyl-tRNA synthetase
MKELSKTYQPNQVEDRIFRLWEQAGYFHRDAGNHPEPYCIVIPPPNVTGVLHMGHALNNTLQDILVRKARMDGCLVRWVVGTDHAGIATQNVVERKLKSDNLTREDLGRDAFLKEVWEWKEKHGSTIINQLKKMGCSCDYSRERFTMDPGLAFAVKKCFVELHEKGLVYRGNRIIHWCPRCLTALSDEEAEHRDIEGKLYTVLYPLCEGDATLRVATTRPETLLGDTAVAVNPGDERFSHLQGKTARLPFVDRVIPVIEDAFVDPEFGTGMVKVTPAHDPNDFEMGRRHDLEQVNVMTDSGVMNENAGPYRGLDRFECREKIVSDLEEAGLLEKVEKHPMAVRQCYRCHTVVEPRISKQWFVRMEPLAQKALQELDRGFPRFTPERFQTIYRRWLEGIRDWCISRQIWWGHRIPVWYCRDCDAVTVTLEDTAAACEHCRSTNLDRDPDVLDTWFSSWLWPFSTLGWPENTPDLETFYPTRVLLTAQEIIFFWVARMVMAGLEFTGKRPFDDVYIHGTVRDETGLKMSKSFGNVIDPLDIIERFGADALRFSLMIVASRGNDIYLSDRKFEIGRNFATKIWNACRFLLMHLSHRRISVSSYRDHADSYSPDDRLILRKTDEMIVTVDRSIKEFRFNDAALCLYDFFWKSFCDRYIESVKLYLGEEGGEDQLRSLAVLFHVLATFLLCLHPVMPFLSEELWQILREIDPGLAPLLAAAPYPAIPELSAPDPELNWTEQKYDLIKAARNLRTQFNLPPATSAEFAIKPAQGANDFLLREVAALQKALRSHRIEIDPAFTPSRPLPSEITPLGTVFMKLDPRSVDLEKERERIRKKIDATAAVLDKCRTKLENEKFLANARPEVVEREREKRESLRTDLEKLKRMIRFFESHEPVSSPKRS